MTTRTGRETWAPEGVRRVLEGLHARRLSGRPLPADDPRLLCPCHQSTFEVLDGARPVFGPATRSLPQLPLMVDDDGSPARAERLQRARRARLLEPRRADAIVERTRPWLDDAPRCVARFARTALNKVFPDHWSFMIGEIAMYCLRGPRSLTGVYLTFFFVPERREVVYHGSYAPLQGVRMSAAYESSAATSASTCAPAW